MSALPPPAAADHAAVAPPAPRDGGAGFAAPAPPGREQIVVAHSGCGYGPAHRLSDNRRPDEDRTRGLVAWVLRSLAASRSRSEGWLSTGDLPGRYRSPGRIRGQQPPAGGDRLPDRGRTPAWAYGDGHRGGDLEAELARLSRGLRTAVVLCDVEGIPDGQVAATRGVKPGAPRGRVHRARTAPDICGAHRRSLAGRHPDGTATSWQRRA